MQATMTPVMMNHDDNQNEAIDVHALIIPQHLCAADCNCLMVRGMHRGTNQNGSRLPYGTPYLEEEEQVGAALHQEAGVEEGVQLGSPCLLVVGEAAAVALTSLPVGLAVAAEVAAVVQMLTAVCLGLQLEWEAGAVGGEGQARTGLSEEH